MKLSVHPLTIDGAGVKDGVAAGSHAVPRPISSPTSATKSASEVFGSAAILSGYRVTFAVPLRQATCVLLTRIAEAERLLREDDRPRWPVRSMPVRYVGRPYR